jgi:hypothetical protein
MTKTKTGREPRLHVQAETLRMLTQHELQRVGGGLMASKVSSCAPSTCACPTAAA